MKLLQIHHTPSHRASRLAVCGLLAAILITAAISYGFIWRAEVLQKEEWRRMIYNITLSMGQNEPCFD